jgi:hypothetical protein
MRHHDFRHVRSLSIAILAILTTTGAAFAEPAQTFHLVSKGTSALAQWSYSDPDNPCVERFAQVIAATNVFRDPGSDPVSSPFCSLFLIESNHCTGELLSGAFGFTESLDDFDFELGPNLDNATASASIPMIDFVHSQDFTASFDVTWSGTGDLVIINRPFVDHVPRGPVQVSQQVQLHRDASAVGTFTDNHLADFLSGLPSTYGALDDSKTNNSIAILVPAEWLGPRRPFLPARRASATGARTARWGTLKTLYR